MEVLYSDDDITISLQYYEKTNMYFIHSKVNQWSLSKYKKYLLIFGGILNNLKDKNILTVYAIPPSEKEEKWESLFGFKDTGMKVQEFKLMGLSYGT
jgi:hypothetical protein